jgi:hypothetical protein
VESAVDPTRSQNITVSWRRSAWAGAGAGGGTDAGVSVDFVVAERRLVLSKTELL